MNRTAWRIGLLLFAVYLLSYSGLIHSTDSLSALAVTESIVEGHGLDSRLAIWQQYGVFHEGDLQGTFGPDGRLYSKRGVLRSLLPAPLFALGGIDPALGRVHLALLTTAIVTAVTGALIYLTGCAAGYGTTTSTAGALAFGLATAAWPYARYFFGEPYTGLGLAMAAYGVVCTRTDGAPKWAALAGAGVALGAGFNLGALAAGPVVLWAVWKEGGHTQRAARVAALALPVVLMLALIAGFNIVRFGAPLDAGRNPQAGEWFNAPVHITVPAILWSPARGLLWYQPLVWLAPLGWYAAPVACRRWGKYLAAVAAIYVAMYGAWYMWWGGFAWGPRFLVPLSPLVALAALPALDRARASRGVWQMGVVLVVMLALGVQVLGVMVDPNIYEHMLADRFGSPDEVPLVYQHGARALWEAGLSPILGHIRLLAETGISDISWFKAGVDWAALVPLAALVGLMAWQLRRACIAVGVLAVLTLAAAGWAMARNSRHPLDPAHLPQPELDYIAAEAMPDDGVLVYVPELTKSILNSYPGFPAAWGMPALIPPDPTLERVLATAQRDHERLWVVSWYDHLDPNAWAEARLAAEHYALSPRRQAVPEGYWIGHYLMRREDEIWRPAGWTLDVGVRLAGYALEAGPGELLRLALRWEALEPIEGDYVVFVHLMDEAGHLVAQADHAPQNAFRPTWTWQAGDVVIDRVALAPGGVWDVHVGMYDWRTPEVKLSGRLPGGKATERFRLFEKGFYD